LSTRRAFLRQGEHPLDERGVLGRFQRGIAEERTDRGQAQVSAADLVAAGGLQVIQKRTQEWGVKIAERELRRWPLQSFLGKSKQQPKRCHGLAQALLKRSLPRALMTDNGAAMLAHETTQGLARLGIVPETTLPFSPYQNGKQEKFWSQIEGRLLPMLEGVADPALRELNEATQAWAEIEYNRKEHSELGQSPLAAYQQAPDAGRPAPDAAAVTLAFTAELVRTQRRSDGTLSVAGVRFEVPSRYGHLGKLHLRVASWDLSQVHLVDPQTGVVLDRLYPLDKHRNATGRRATRVGPVDPTPLPPTGVAPLLAQLIAQYAATGLPPAYLPKSAREVQS